jgi:Chaperone of endosialidase
MVSQIDVTVPVYGDPTTQSVRDNFQTAHDEIDALQVGFPFLPIAGGIVQGPLTVNGALTVGTATAPGGISYINLNSEEVRPIGFANDANGKMHAFFNRLDQGALVTLAPNGDLLLNGNVVAIGMITANGGLNVTGNSAASGTVWGKQGVYANSDSSLTLQDGGANRYLTFAGDWYWGWNVTTGMLSWVGDGNLLFSVDGHGNLVAPGSVTALGSVACGNLGVVYADLSTNGFKIYWDGTTSYLMRMNANPVTDAVIGTWSDERLKQDIAPSGFDCLAAILATPLFQYRWKDNSDLNRPMAVSSDAPLMPVGFVAQRVHDVFPEGVRVGAPLPDDHPAGETTYWQMNDQTILAALVGAVQQLDAKLTAQDTRLAALESAR